MKSVSQVNKDTILVFLRKHKGFLEKEFGVTEIALFGSYARGEETAASDIDLLIKMNVVKFRNRLRLRDFLEKHFNKKVDVSFFDSVRKYIMYNIEEELAYA